MSAYIPNTNNTEIQCRSLSYEMADFIDTVCYSPVHCIAHVSATQRRYYVRDIRGRFILIREEPFHSNARNIGPFLPHKDGILRCEDGKICDYSKKRMIKTVYRPSIAKIFDIFDKSVLVLTIAGTLAIVNITSKKQESEIESADQTHRIEKACFVSGVGTIATLYANGSIYINSKILDVPATVVHVIDICGTGTMLYYISIPGMEEYIAKKTVQVHAVQLQEDNTTVDTCVATRPHSSAIRVVSAIPYCYDAVAKVWENTLKPAQTSLIIPSNDNICAMVNPVTNEIEYM